MEDAIAADDDIADIDIGRTKMIEDSKLAQPRFRGMSHGVKLIVAEEGYRGLYRGVGPVVSLAAESSEWSLDNWRWNGASDYCGWWR